MTFCGRWACPLCPLSHLPASLLTRARVLAAACPPGPRPRLRVFPSVFLSARGHALPILVLKGSTSSPAVLIQCRPWPQACPPRPWPHIGSRPQVHRRATCVCGSYWCVYSGVIECGPDFPCGVYTSTGMYCRYILTCDRVYCFYCNPEWRILLEGCCIPVGECNVLVGVRDILAWGL